MTNLIRSGPHADMLADMRQSLADWMERHEDGLVRQYKRMRME